MNIRRRAPAQPRFVAGSIGPSGKLPSADDPELSNITFDELADIFREQAVGLIEGGVDLLLIETSQDILEVKAAITGCHKAFDETGICLPIQAQVTLDTTGRMLLGTDIAAALTILEGLGIDVIGLNCSTGPEHMREPIRILGEQSTPARLVHPQRRAAAQRGRRRRSTRWSRSPSPTTLAEFVDEVSASRVVGGCCGTTPDTSETRWSTGCAGIATRSAARTDHRRAWPPPCRPSPCSRIPPPILIGERCNAQGSAKFKQLLLAEDYDGILADRRASRWRAARTRSTCPCAVTERPDEAELMRKRGQETRDWASTSRW